MKTAFSKLVIYNRKAKKLQALAHGAASDNRTRFRSGYLFEPLFGHMCRIGDLTWPEHCIIEQSMEENGNSLKTAGAAVQTLRGRGMPSKKSSRLYSFPTRNDPDTQIAKATAKRLKIPFVDPMGTRVEPAVVSLLEPETAFRRQAMPIRMVDDTLLVAMLAPEQPVAIRSLELLTGFKIRPAATPKNSLSAALERYYGNGNDEKP